VAFLQEEDIQWDIPLEVIQWEVTADQVEVVAVIVELVEAVVLVIVVEEHLMGVDIMVVVLEAMTEVFMSHHISIM
jgi:hypothetical protein